MELEQIQDLYRERRQGYSEDFRTRIHRALSWVRQARSESLDLRFATLWIAFNAIYAQRIGNQFADPADRAALRSFLNRLCELDDGHEIYDLLWNEYPGNIRALIDCQWIYRGFWEYQLGRISRAAFEEDFARAKEKVKAALSEGDTEAILATVFDRLYTLRNQVIHGGATCGSAANRKQLSIAAALLWDLDLAIIKIMLDAYPREQWGALYYPFVREA
ncbi:MAG: hypothetical protein K6A65_02090 [Succinivibrionaceae bacterium]|nr:hypothetical protein [Succinivibrionaceae bacterium]